MKNQNITNEIPKRKNVPSSDCWDLSDLYRDDKKWEEDLKKLEKKAEDIDKFKNTLGQSPSKLKACMDFNNEIGMLMERLGYYSQLRVSEDGGDSENQGRLARFMNISSRCNALMSYQNPEIMEIPDEVISNFLKDPILDDYVITLKQILRYKPYILSEKEEKLLAMQSEFSQTAQNAFSSLVDVDIDFGFVETPGGEKKLTQSTYGSLIISHDREVRKKTYLGLLQKYDDHKNTLANLYNGSVQLDTYKTRVRSYKTSLENSLFSDNVPDTVYDNLIQTVHDNLEPLHKYYNLRKRVLKLDALHLYDTRVPLVKEINMHHSYEEGVNKVINALIPLGNEYISILKQGLLEKWVDKYENQGKQSGAFSAGSYNGAPYILMNFKEDNFNDLFTLAHEAGHSMHSWYSVKNNPFQHYGYSIFVAEVASTFNEQLLNKFFMDNTQDVNFKAYLINKQIDDIIATLFRQTMFAEFEKITHKMAEKNIPLTIDSIRSEYKKLLKLYFGPEVILEDISDLEGLRIPHFYNAFYVYKYATGISAALALSQRVINGGTEELSQYINFLKSGGSKFPLDQLKNAGVDMISPAPIQAAIKVFSSLTNQLENLLL